MIKLFVPGEAWGVLNASPFCMKLELYMIYHKIPYTKITEFDFAKAPRGKVPYISDGEAIITDSSLIIEYLNSRFNIEQDSHLSEEQESISHFILEMIENSLYWCMVYERWGIGSNWKITKKTFFGNMPRILYYIIPNMVRKNIMRDMKGHGMGRREHSEIQALAIKDIDMIGKYLWDKQFIFGDKISTIDLAVYSTLANLMLMPHESKIKDHINSDKKLVKYIKNIQDIFA